MFKKILGLSLIVIPLGFIVYLLLKDIIEDWDDIITNIKFILHCPLFYLVIGVPIYWGLISWCFPYEPPIPYSKDKITYLDN